MPLQTLDRNRRARQIRCPPRARTSVRTTYNGRVSTHPEAQFEPSAGPGTYMVRWGAGNPARDPEVGSRRKLCFVATDKPFLVALLLELSHRRDCAFVKYSRSPRDGMFLGRCFLLDDDRVGELWQLYKRHPKLMCSVQDDDWSLEYRKRFGEV